MRETNKTETSSSESTFSRPGHKDSITIHNTIKSFLLSRKLWSTIFALCLLWLMFWKQIDYLFSFSGYELEVIKILVPAFTGLVRDVMVCFTAIIGAYLGIQGLVQWKHGTESIVSQASELIHEKREETITENINQTITYNNTKEDDYTLEDPDKYRNNDNRYEY